MLYDVVLYSRVFSVQHSEYETVIHRVLNLCSTRFSFIIRGTTRMNRELTRIVQPDFEELR